MIDLNEKPLCTTPRIACWAVDNLELLKSQPDESVDLIYCDILYGTGRNFEDYQDLKPQKDIVEEFYIPRVKEMHRVLKETGNIYLQMDYRINHWIRLILDDVFSYNNFRNEIIWCYSKMGSSNNSLTNNHDTILNYSKNIKYAKFSNVYEDIESALKRRLRRFVSGDNKIYYKSVKNHSSQLMDNYIKSAMNRLGRDLCDDDIVIDFKSRDKAKIDDVWYVPIIKGNSKEKVGYDTQKPKALLERIVKASSNEGDVVADFFCGSGTTAVVCKELNRNFIGCDINPKAIEITKGRLNGGQ